MKITFKGFLGLAQLGLKNYWFLMSWFVFCFFVFRCDFNFYKKAPQYFYLRQILGVGVCISRGTASVVNVGIVFLAIPMGRRIISLVRGLLPLKITLLASSLLPPGKTIHLIVAWTILIASVFHSLSHIINVLNYSRHYIADIPEINMASFKDQSALVLIFSSVPGITGVLMLVILLFLAATSLKCVRRETYEIFYYCHHCFIIFIVLLLLHPLSGVLKGVDNVESHPPGCINKWNFTGNTKNISNPQYQMVHRDEKDKDISTALKKRDMRQFGNEDVSEMEVEGFTKVFPNIEDLSSSVNKISETENTLNKLPQDEISSVLQSLERNNLKFIVKNNKISFTKSDSNSSLPETSTEKLNFNVNSSLMNLLRSTSSISDTIKGESSFHVDSSTMFLSEFETTSTLAPETRESKKFSKPKLKKIENYNPIISNISTLENISMALGLNNLLEKVDRNRMYFLAFKVEPKSHSVLNSQFSPFLDTPNSENLQQINKRKNLSIHSDTKYLDPIVTKERLPNTDSILMPHLEQKSSTNTNKSSFNFQGSVPKTTDISVTIGEELHFRPSYKPFTNESNIRSASEIFCQKPPVFVSIQSESWKWILILFLYLLIDFSIKRIRGMEEVEVLLVKNLPAHTFELTLKKSGFKCSPGQYVLLRCSTVSKYEWHPFTVAKCPTDESSPLVLLLRTKGNWCRKLQHAFSKQSVNYVCESPFIFETLPVSPKACDCKSCQCADKPNNPSSILNTDSYNCENCLKECLNKNLASQKSERLSTRYCTHCSNSVRLNTAYCSYSWWPKFHRNKSTRSTAPLTSSHNTPNINCKKCIKLSQCTNEQVEVKDSIEANNDSIISVDSINDEQNGVVENTLESVGNGDSSSSSDTTVIIENENIRNSQQTVCCSKYISCEDILSNQSNTVSHGDQESQKTIKLHFDGPYNSPNEYMVSYPVVIAIAGGIGITPLLASLSYLMKTGEAKPHHIHIVWVFRELEMPFPFLPFFQSTLDKFWVQNQEDRLELGFYCTQGSGDLETHLNMTPKRYKDLVPFLRARLKFGRPNWEELFKVWKEYYEGNDVGVFCCGPKSLNKQISRYCLHAVGEGLRFSYHHESFS